MKPKTPPEQYFLRADGSYVGDCEALYRACEDPWDQSAQTPRSPLKNLIIFRVSQLPERRVLDIGCGKGDFSHLLCERAQADVLGIDVSPTAISKAKARYPQGRFEVADALEVERFAAYRPTAVTAVSITWCILDRFQDFLDRIRRTFSGALFFHTLTFYAPGQQKHGADYFTSLDELLPYFSGMTVQETFTHVPYPSDGSYNTLVVARL